MVGTWLISEAFIRVTLPLAVPGIFAGSLLTFIPAVGDYINAELLGNPRSLMIGNVIQARYLRVTDYPTASALSFILMAAILIGVLIYIRPARHRGPASMTATATTASIRERSRSGRVSTGPSTAGSCQSMSLASPST